MSTIASDPDNATITGREEINRQLIILRVHPDAELFSFAPGQFAVLGLLEREPRVPEAGADGCLPVRQPGHDWRGQGSPEGAWIGRRPHQTTRHPAC